MWMWMPMKNTPAVGDLDGDGDLEVVAGGSHAGTQNPYTGTANGYLYAWTDFAGKLGSPAGAHPAYSAPWPMFRGNAAHTGATPALVSSRYELFALLEKGRAITYPLTFDRTDGLSLSWSVVETDPQGVVKLDRTNGSAATPRRVTLDAPNAAGTYEASIRVQASGLQPLTIPIRLVVVDQVRATFAPLVGR
jgi:hypothetical protein